MSFFPEDVEIGIDNYEWDDTFDEDIEFEKLNKRSIWIKRMLIAVPLSIAVGIATFCLANVAHSRSIGRKSSSPLSPVELKRNLNTGLNIGVTDINKLIYLKGENFRAMHDLGSSESIVFSLDDIILNDHEEKKPLLQQNKEVVLPDNFSEENVISFDKAIGRHFIGGVDTFAERILSKKSLEFSTRLMLDGNGKLIDINFFKRANVYLMNIYNFIGAKAFIEQFLNVED